MLDEMFEKIGIEYYSVADYRECKIINQRLEDKMQFTPRSVIVFLVPYYAGECVNISRYAASYDYHIIIKELAGRLSEKLKQIYPVSNFVGFGDHSPIDERECALRAGLGFMGDNGLIINEKYGSYVFLGDIVTDVPYEELSGRVKKAKVSAMKECDHCGACKRCCPTGILRGESRECLSAITQRKGQLSEEEIRLMRKYNTVWGCDICQSSCPYNSNPEKTPLEIFYRNRIEKLDMRTLDSLTDEEFEQRAFAWRGRGVLERNIQLLTKGD